MSKKLRETTIRNDIKWTIIFIDDDYLHNACSAKRRSFGFVVFAYFWQSHQRRTVFIRHLATYMIYEANIIHIGSNWWNMPIVFIKCFLNTDMKVRKWVRHSHCTSMLVPLAAGDKTSEEGISQRIQKSKIYKLEIYTYIPTVPRYFVLTYS